MIWVWLWSVSVPLQVISCLRKLDGLVLEQRYIGSSSSRPGEAERSELEHKLQVGACLPACPLLLVGPRSCDRDR